MAGHVFKLYKESRNCRQYKQMVEQLEALTKTTMTLPSDLKAIFHKGQNPDPPDPLPLTQDIEDN